MANSYTRPSVLGMLCTVAPSEPRVTAGLTCKVVAYHARSCGGPGISEVWGIRWNRTTPAPVTAALEALRSVFSRKYESDAAAALGSTVSKEFVAEADLTLANQSVTRIHRLSIKPSTMQAITPPRSYAELPCKEIRLSHHPSSSPDPTPIIVVTLYRPEKYNAYTAVMMKELEDVFAFLSVDDRVNCVVVTGHGRMFCAGADLQRGFKQGEGMESEREHRDG